MSTTLSLLLVDDIVNAYALIDDMGNILKIKYFFYTLYTTLTRKLP